MDYFNKSERQSFLKLLLSGGLYMLFGNILCAIMTLSTAPFIGNDFMKVLIFILAMAIFYSLMFTVAYKDGNREKRYVTLHKCEEPDMKKWVKIGAALMGIMFAPSVVLLIAKLTNWYFDITLIHRIVDGMIYPLSLLLVPDSNIDSMQIFVPFIYMLCYALIPVITHLGFYYGYTGKLEKGNIMYE